MPSGHTDKATINERRPLTDNMLTVLRSIYSRRDETHAVLFQGEMIQWEKNAARALLDRDLVGFDNSLCGYYLTDQGKLTINDNWPSVCARR